MSFLAELRARVALARAAGDPAAHAAAAVELAEAEPLLGHRVSEVRAAIDAAGVVLDGVADPTLRARLMLRLAHVKLVETDWDAADQALEAAGRYAVEADPDAPEATRGGALKLLAAMRACRVAIRRGPRERAVAQQLLVATAQRLTSLSMRGDEATWKAVTIELALAIAEAALHDEPPPLVAFEPIGELVDELAGDPRRVDATFACRQLLAAYALSHGELQPALRALRAIVKLAADAGSPADEVEARLALVGALVEGGDPINVEEAARHAQVARDRSLEHGLTELHHAALIAQAGVLAHGGKTAGALDRVLELARAAVAKQDVRQYVAAVGIMAELYARANDHVSAFRTIAEAHHALEAATGDDATPLFRPLLARLRDRIGQGRLEQIAGDVDRANRLAAELAERKPSDPS